MMGLCRLQSWMLGPLLLSPSDLVALGAGVVAIEPGGGRIRSVSGEHKCAFPGLALVHRNLVNWRYSPDAES